MHSQKVDFSSIKSRFNRERKLMLFDLSIYGHHPSYIQHLIEYWCKQRLSGSLNIVVSPKFIQEHFDVVSIASKLNQANINFVAIALEEEAALKSRKSGFSRTLRAFQEWNLFCKYASFLKATQCLFMYFDTCQLPIAFGRGAPCPFSGIYFKPTFHYGDFTNYLPSLKDRLQHQREKFLLSLVLRNSQLQTLFCLDSFVVKHLDSFRTKVEAVYLPDPVKSQNEFEFQSTFSHRATAGDALTSSKRLREKLGISADKQVFLLFGALDGRKGIYQLLEAILLLPPVLLQKFCLVFIGESNPVDKELIESQVATVCQSQPVQIVRHYEFVPEQDVTAYFQLADVVLAPYQRHVGMSGILLLAAAAQKPVLSSNYGLMGEIVQRYNLGLTVDSTVPSEIAKSLTRFLLESPEALCDRTKMKLLAEQNSTERFASVIFQYV